MTLIPTFLLPTTMYDNYKTPILYQLLHVHVLYVAIFKVTSTYIPVNQPDSMLVAPHIVRPIVNPIVFIIGTTSALPVSE